MKSDQMQIEKNNISKSVAFQFISHDAISKDFVNKFSNSLNFGISLVNSYFDPNVSCSLYIYHSQTVDLFETIGYTNLENKLSNLGIRTFKYVNNVQTSQLIGSDSILISLIGQVSVNDQVHNFGSVFVLRKKNSEYLIINYILQLFVQ